jgi:type IV pilus assembly protein PilC
MLLNLSRSLRNQGLKLIAGVLGLSLGIKFYLSTPGGKRKKDWLLLKLPIIGKLKLKIILIRITRTLGMMLQNGVNLLTGIDNIINLVSNTQIKHQLKSLKQKVKAGQAISECLGQTILFPNLVLQFIRTGEKTGKLDMMLLKVAQFYEQEVKHQLDFFISLLKPGVILLVSGLVAAIVAAMLLPLFKMTSFI